MGEVSVRPIYIDHWPLQELLAAYWASTQVPTSAIIEIADSEYFQLARQPQPPESYDYSWLFGAATPPVTVTVPNIVGMTSAAALAAIATAGCLPGVITSAYSGSVAVGVVISQVPVALFVGLAPLPVSYVLSLGPFVPPTPPGNLIPNLTGLTQAQAQSLLTTLRLAIGSSTSFYE
jgi:hypothetical protein